MHRLSLSLIMVCISGAACVEEVEDAPIAAVAFGDPGARNEGRLDQRVTADNIPRLPPQIVHERVTSGSALLVCAYESDIGFWAAEIEGAISFKEFRHRLPSIPKDEEIFFYCA